MRFKCFLSFFFISMQVFLLPSVSAALPTTPELQAQREAFLALSKRIRNTSVRRLDTLLGPINEFRDYPLFPYLYYEWINRNLTYRNRKQINAFLQDTKGVPIRNVLLKKWLTYLAKNNYKTLFLNTYEAGLGTDLMCRNMHALRVQNGTNEAWFKQVEVVWLSGYSQPKACDPVLSYWRKNGGLTPDLALRRIGLAGKAGQRSLTRYLKRFAAKKDHYVADLWEQVRRNPNVATNPKRFPFRHVEQETEIVKWGLTHLSWREPLRVTRALDAWEKSQKLPPDSLQAIKETVAISLTLDDHDHAFQWLQRAASVHASHSLWRWYLAQSVRKQDWSQVISIVKTAPAAQKTSSEFMYWQARALVNSGQTQEGQALFRQLAKERHYYGFMSAAHLNQLPLLNNARLLSEPNIKEALSTHPQLLRARELFALKSYVSARREWFGLMKTLNDGQQIAAVQFAHEWGWHDQAIVGALRAGAKDDLTIRFPLAFAKEFQSRSLRYNVDPSFAMAISRRESSFMPDAVSSADARGIMQVLPSTAKYLVNVDNVLSSKFKRSMRRKSLRYELLTPAINIEFGMGYLQYLQQKMGDNAVLHAAAYNAGWQKVTKWLPQKKPVPMDIWVDTIPFKETREYVKAVLTYQLIYDWHRNQPLTLFDGLTQMTINPR